MSTREILLRRADVPNEDIDDVIGIAQQLQDAERAAASGASLDEVRAVASELDIAPEYVEQALEVLRDQRRKQAEVSKQRSETTRRALLASGVVALGVLGVGGLTWGGMAAVRASTRADLDRAEAHLDVVLQRQAALAPQLLAVAGGDAEGLDALAEQVRSGDTVEERLRASEALGLELARRLGTLPPATSDAAAQQRLSLQHELSGAQNRITVERRRYEEARLAYEQSGGC